MKALTGMGRFAHVLTALCGISGKEEDSANLSARHCFFFFLFLSLSILSQICEVVIHVFFVVFVMCFLNLA